MVLVAMASEKRSDESASLGPTNITPTWTFRIGSQGLCLRPYPKELFLQVIGL